MESSLFIAVKAPSAQHIKNASWMLGLDAPVFDDEVPAKWRPMFIALEEMIPESVHSLSNDVLLLTWLCGDWFETFQSLSSDLNKAGFDRQAAYFWADEEEGYLSVKDGDITQVKQDTKNAANAPELKIPKKWDSYDKRIARTLALILVD